MRFYTTSMLSPHIGETPEGYLVCYNVPIGRTGIQVYGAEDLPGVSAKNGEILVNRPAEEVFRDTSMASFEGKPVTLLHPDEDVSPENWKELAEGIAQNVRRDGDLLVADLLITGVDAIAAVKSDRLRQISCGYDAEYREIGPGVAEQYAITGNHVALVDAGRAGARCSIRDTVQPKKGSSMATRRPLSFLDRWRGKMRDTTGEALAALEEKVTAEGGEVEIKPGKEPGEVVIKVEGLEEVKAAETPASTQDEPGASNTPEWVARLLARFEALEARIAKAESGKPATGDEQTRPVEDELSGTQDGEPGVMPDGDPKPTADRAHRALWQDTLYRASLLAPGLGVPTYDSARSAASFADTLTRIKRRAIDNAYTTAEGRRVIAPWIGGDGTAIRSLDAMTVDAVFSAASDAMARRNNKTLGFADSATASGPLTPAQINDANRKFWDERTVR